MLISLSSLSSPKYFPLCFTGRRGWPRDTVTVPGTVAPRLFFSILTPPYDVLSWEVPEHIMFKHHDSDDEKKS